MNRKHFVIYLLNNEIITTTPKDWSRANENHFQDFNFMNGNNTPTTDVIESYLILNLGFTRVENDNAVVCFKF